MTDWTTRLEEVDSLLASGHPKQAMQAAGSVLEDFLREIYRETAATLPPADQQKVAEKAEKIGKNKAVTDFTLGQIVGLFREAQLFDDAERALRHKLTHLPSANFNAFVDLRNRAAHKGEDVSEEEARFFAAQIRLFVKEVGWLDEVPASTQSGTASVRRLRPWTDIVRLHPDVEAGDLIEAVFAIDLGAIAMRDPKVPAVNRDPEAFFHSTYLTADLRKLLDEVLASLAGKSGYNRVLKLRTPFGGGKSHTLAALLHAARDRRALNVLPEAKGLADPGKVAVAVFDGEKFDARDGATVADGCKIQTIWGWIAWQIDPEKAFPLVKGHDQDRVAPGGDVIRALLTTGASGRPVLLLLDEVLKYMERAGGVAVLDSTLQRQSKDFFQSLTVEVAGSANAAMVYSLQWSSRESLGNVALLQELDKLAARVDQLREPVSGDEILPILQRRLLAATPPADAAQEAADAYGEVVTNMRRAYADSPAARRQADDDGLSLRNRVQKAYPFHPALIDVMKERWTAVDAFQRTRGALRFLASCLHALKRDGGAQAVLGPGEVPLKNAEVRRNMLKELSVQNEYDPVITADIDGPNARAKRIDDRMARDNPALGSVRPATRLGTAILVYSFGGLRRHGAAEGDTLPSGVTENDLLDACVGPNLDNVTATAVLSELRRTCLYLHFDGVRYCFKKDPNVTKLVEDAEQEVARNPQEVKDRIRKLLDQRLGGHRDVFVWPQASRDLPDEEPHFVVGYAPLDLAAETRSEQERWAKEMFSKYGDRLRKYRNGVGLVMPDKKPIESLRRAVRYLLAVERVEEKKQQLRLSKDQLEQLREHRRTHESAAESALRSLYTAVWLPRVENGALGIEKVEVGGRVLAATGVHERVMELLTEGGIKRVHGSVTPRKIVERLKLGESLAPGEPPRFGIRVPEVVEAFFRDIEPPRLDSSAALRGGIARGVAEGAFAYTSGAFPSLGPDNKFQVSRDKVVFNQPLAADEVDFDSGFLMVPTAIPEAPATGTSPTTDDGGVQPAPEVDEPRPPIAEAQRAVRLRFKATRDQVFKAFPAVANLTDKADGGRVTLTVEANRESGFDRSWLRNAVEEPLDEADVEREES